MSARLTGIAAVTRQLRPNALIITLFALGFCALHVPVVAQVPQNPASGTGANSNSDPLADARALLQAGNIGAAETAVRDYLAKHARVAEAHFLLGEILFKQQKAKESLAEYTAGAKYRTPGASDLRTVAFDYVLLRDYADADKWLTRAVQEAPNDVETWYFLGRARYNENRFADAVSAFQHCLKLDPKNVKAEDNLGLAYQGLDRISDAIAAFQAAITWQHDATIKSPDPFINLGALLIEQNRPKEAVEYLSQALAIPPAIYRAEGMTELEPQAHEHLAKAYSRLNQLDKAEMELKKAVALAPNQPQLHYLLGQIYRQQGLTDKAKAEFERFTALTGKSDAARDPNR